MKSRILAACIIGLFVTMGLAVSAQRPFTQHLEYLEEFFAGFPPIPPVPPVPPIPPIPPLPPFEGFNFAFNWQGARGEEAANPEIRFQQDVYRSLLRNNPERGIEVATERLKVNAGDPVVLGNLSAIANSGSAKALPLLISIAKTSSNPGARREATLSIARGRDSKETLAILEDLYGSTSDNVEVRQAVVSSISRISDPQAVSLLARIVRNDSDESIRRTAIRLLGSRKEPEAMKVLEDLLK